jgi:hypothetical protein
VRTPSRTPPAAIRIPARDHDHEPLTAGLGARSESAAGPGARPGVRPRWRQPDLASEAQGEPETGVKRSGRGPAADSDSDRDVTVTVQ